MKHTNTDQRNQRFSQLVAALALLTAGVLVGCGGDSGDSSSVSLVAAIPTPFEGEQVEDTYVGMVPNTGYLVAVVSDGERAAGYLCDGQGDAWLGGDAAGSSVEIAGPGPTGEVSIRFSTASGRGVLRIAGAPDVTFTARLAAENEGVFRVDDDAGLRGWIRIGKLTTGLFRRRRGGGTTAPPPPPPPGSTDPCEGMGSDSSTAANPGACHSAICDSASRVFATATTAAERTQAEQRAAGEGCILNPFVDLNQP